MYRRTGGLTRHFLTVLFASAALLAALSVAPAPVEAKPKYAALVMDKYSGRVLFSRNADSYRYPASLTKIMTLYIVFEELAQENITLKTKWPVSSYAAGQAPSKLGLDPGDTISVENAILALVTKSANDVAVVIAEGIEGSEREFAKRMTETARRMGMARTTFRNPHGLPDKRQVTTARDMATLAQRVMDDFPQYYSFFSTESFNFRGRTFNNHNNLLGKYEGTNGIKTGYTRASGFNLTASVMRDGKHLVGVVMGGKTPRSRDSHMEEILDEAFLKVPTRGRTSIAAAPPVPRLRPESPLDALPAAEAARLLAAAETGVPAAPAAANDVKPPVEPVALAALKRDEAARTMAPIPEVRPSTAEQETATAAPRPEARPAERAADAAREVASAGAAAFSDVSAWLVTPANARESAPDAITGAGDISQEGSQTLARLDAGAPSVEPGAAWRIQIGAYSDAEEAGQRIKAALSRAPGVLNGKGPATVPVRTSSRTLYRSRFTGFNGEDQARNACATLIREGISCITVPPDNWYAPTAN